MVAAIAIDYPAAGIHLPVWPVAASRCWRRRTVAPADLSEQPKTDAPENPRGYTRRPEVEAEIRALPAVANAGFAEAALAGRFEETLVFAMRALVRSGNRAATEPLLERLLECAERRVAEHLNRLLRSWEDREDAARTVAARLWEEVFDLSPQKSFWDINFTWKLKKCCIDAVQPHYRQRANERQFKRSETSDDRYPDEAASLPDPVEIDADLYVPEWLMQLEGVVRQAAVLKYHGYQEKSNDPTEDTISSLLGVTDRSVRNYLKKAREILSAGRDEMVKG